MRIQRSHLLLSPTQRILRPAAAPGPLANPLKGWCPYANAGPISQPYSMVFQYIAWRDLEPKPGEYRFEAWEKSAWEEPQARGKQIIFRVYADYPGKPSGLPDWLVAQGVPTTAYSEEGGGISPAYDDPRCREAMERLIAALGRRYDRHPRVAFVQMGLLGFWGEWHTYPRTELFASPATQERILEAAHRAFPNKIVMTRYPQSFPRKQDWLGFFDDLFPEDTDGPHAWEFLPRMRKAGLTENWKHRAIGGEMSPGKAKLWLGENYDQTLRRMRDAHFSWVGPYGPALEKPLSPDFVAHSQEMVRSMGYQFRLTEIRHDTRIGRDGHFAIAISGENTGLAPFYYPWPVEVALLTPDRQVVTSAPLKVDIRTWLPGRFQVQDRVPLAVRSGVYTLAIGIRNPWKQGMPFRFANTLPESQEWTLLSEVTVAKA